MSLSAVPGFLEDLAVAKILVADDNSNIQKMVGLALKDQGIDVVAVGNGEAAVRKISDVKPDLVLADVFMPVRNGYEVCKYVKDDSALSHIPVILLVGAFDPLDEQEAQRVGADGVLKKPFVPPDPLISMVKSALSRAGVNVATAAEEPVPVKAEPEFKPLALHTPPPPAPPPAPAFEEPQQVDDIPARPAPISIDRGAQPLAFGSLLETPTPETEEDDAGFVSPSRPDRDWKSSDEEMDVAEEESDEEPSWRPGGTDLDDKDIPAGKKDWREVAFANIPETPAKSSYSAVEEQENAVEWVSAEQVVSEATSAYAAEDTWSAAVAKDAEVETQPVVEAAPPVPSPQAISMPDIISVQDAAPVSAPAVPAIPEPPPAAAPVKQDNSSWMSVAPSPWEAEVAKATKLAATWDSPATVASGTPAAVPEIGIESEVASSLPAATEEAIREEAAQVVEEEVENETEERTAEVSPAKRADEAPAPAPPNVDDMVAKVLAKMDPSVLQAMTKELLKPVIETIVREELNKK